MSRKADHVIARVERLIGLLEELRWDIRVQDLRALIDLAKEHTPPPGWCWTELSRGDRSKSNTRRHWEGGQWWVVRDDGGVTEGQFATAQEAVKAYEKDKQT